MKEYYIEPHSGVKKEGSKEIVIEEAAVKLDVEARRSEETFLFIPVFSTSRCASKRTHDARYANKHDSKHQKLALRVVML